MDSTHGRGGGTSPPTPSGSSATTAVPAPAHPSSYESAPPPPPKVATFAQPSPLSTYVSTFSANGVSSSFSSTSSTSLNYGDEELAPLHPNNKSLKSARLVVATDKGGKLVRMPTAAQTWRDWSPVRRPATGSVTGRKKETTEEEEGLLTARRSMDWSEMRGERRSAAAGKEVGAQPGRKKTKARKHKHTEKGNGSDDDSHSGSDSESESDSSSSSSSSEDERKAKKERKRKKKERKAKKKSKRPENGHGHGHGKHKEKKKKHEDIENQLKSDKAHKKRRKKKPSGYIPIYLDREKGAIPLMEPLPQVLGFVMWQVATFVLGLSLGIFLSGITPGYDVADVGINSHWWNVDLNKPVFQPPDSVLAPVWLSTFFLAAVGMWVVWRRGGWKRNKLATSLYLIHLFVFQIWLCMFFFLHGLLLSVLTAMLGWALMLVCMIAFLKRSWVAFGLLSFAFAWKTFIVLDVLVIWWINSGELTRQT